MSDVSDGGASAGGPEVPEDLPDSAQRVFRALAIEGPLTHRELVEATAMPARTVRFAVARLREEGLVGQRSNLMDGRQHFFYLAGSEDGPPPRRL